ncbi:MAG: M23 family metallopeptidase [Deltaproteobacteria bacterium]|nr:M23 family metallopeptidase [Deltaproteobacteria bacterium]
MKKYRTMLILTFIIVLALGAFWFFFTYCEGEKPSIVMESFNGVIGTEGRITIDFIDTKTGLRDIAVSVTQEENKHVLHSLTYRMRGIHHETVRIAIHPGDIPLKDGRARLDMSAVDYSLRKNTCHATLDVVIDTTPPRIDPVSTQHYLNMGGSGVALYHLSEENTTTGILVGDDYFQAYPFVINGAKGYVCYFACPLELEENDISLNIIAEDAAGNRSLCSLPHHVRDRKFKRDTMNISMSFLEKKMPEFRRMIKGMEQASLLEVFRYVNDTMRQDNFKTVQQICSTSEPRQLWEGTFLRMKNSAPMALFGDRRTYCCEGSDLGKSVHLGVDLASVQCAPVEAANTGMVVFADYLGIYGNTVIIDHGLGLFSFYAHLSSINVATGEGINRGDIIGKTGTTGLAGGDHLHFGMYVGNRFVNPQEWWDPHWIRDNVTKKMEGINGLTD